MRPAIVLAMHTVGLGVTRALGKMGVPVVGVYHDEDHMAQVSRYVTTSQEAPHPEREPRRYVDLLLHMSERWRGALLIPTCDATLGVVSRHKEVLAEHYVVAAPEWESVQKILDKKLLYDLAEASGVPAPRTLVPASEAEVDAYSRSIEYPCLVKPREGHRFFERFRRKMTKVSGSDELMRAYRAATDAGFAVMLQEYVPGPDGNGVNYNSYVAGGQILADMTAAKVRNAPPETGSPRVVVSRDVPGVREPARKILAALSLYGFSNIEFKRDARDGAYRLMDVNGRHNLSCLLAVRAGLNFPWIEYQHLMNGERPATARWQQGVYWIHMDKDLPHSLRYWASERYPLRDYVRPYVSRRVFAVFDWRDPRPFIKRAAHAARHGWDLARSGNKLPPAPATVRDPAGEPNVHAE